MRFLLFILVTSIVAHGQGTILWDESVNGQFFQDFHTPTSLVALQPGTNSIIGLTEIDPNGNNWTIYPDYFTVTVPSALHVNAVYLGIDNINVWAWIGDPSYANQIGFVDNAANGDLLAQWGITSVSPGVYGIEFSDADLQPIPSMANYRLDFFVESIPEPNSFSLILGGLGFLGIRRWRRPS